MIKHEILFLLFLKLLNGKIIYNVSFITDLSHGFEEFQSLILPLALEDAAHMYRKSLFNMKIKNTQGEAESIK